MARARPVVPLCIVLVTALIGALSGRARAQGRAVVLRSAGPGPYKEAAAGFQAAWKPATELVVREGESDRLVERIRGLEPEIVFAIGPAAARLHARHLPELPVVRAFTPDEPETVAGTPAIVMELEVPPAVQLRWISRSLPDVERVGVLYDPAHSDRRIERLRQSAEDRGVKLVAAAVEAASGVRPAFDNMAPGIDALLFVPDETVSTKGNVREILRRCLVERIPAIGYIPWYAENGAVMALSADYRQLGRTAASHAADRPEDPAEAARSIPPESVIATFNLRVARKLRVRVDASFDDPAVRVIE